jgi:hypothetical protein
LKRLAKDKHSSSLRKSVNYDRKKFYSTGPRKTQVIKVLTAVECFTNFATAAGTEMVVNAVTELNIKATG